MNPKIKPAAPKSPVTPVIGLKALAAHFDVSTRTILRWIARGDIPAPSHAGGQLLRWSVAELNDWIDAGCPPVTQGQ